MLDLSKKDGALIFHYEVEELEKLEVLDFDESWGSLLYPELK